MPDAPGGCRLVAPMTRPRVGVYPPVAQVGAWHAQCGRRGGQSTSPSRRHGPVCVYLVAWIVYRVPTGAGLSWRRCLCLCRVYCGRMNGCNDPGGRWNAQCMTDSCRVPLEMCFGEPNLPGQAPPSWTHQLSQEVVVHWASAISVSSKR